MSTKFLDSQGLDTLWKLIRKEVSSKAGSTINTTAVWAQKETYIPTPGEIIVYSDYKTTTDILGNVVKTEPAIKIGDGRTPVGQLSFYQAPVADKVAHSLTIGNQVYDGSKNVVIATYAGETD